MTTFSKKSLFESQREGFRFEGVGSNPDVFQNKASQNITKNVYKIIVYNQSIVNELHSKNMLISIYIS